MQELVISVKQEGKKDKTRQFRAVLLAWLTADMLWEGGKADTKTRRPVFLAVAGTETGLKPFLANIRNGRKATILGGNHRSSYQKNDELELLRSANWAINWQRGEREQIVTLYQPELFALDPGLIDPFACSFISAPPTWWAEDILNQVSTEQAIQVLAHARALGILDQGENKLNLPIAFDGQEVLQYLPSAVHFCMYLDKRTRRPLVNDLRFSLQLYLAALVNKLATTSYGWAKHKWAEDAFVTCDTARLGLHSLTLMHTNHTSLDGLLAKQVQIYQEVTR